MIKFFIMLNRFVSYKILFVLRPKKFEIMYSIHIEYTFQYTVHVLSGFFIVIMVMLTCFVVRAQASNVMYKNNCNVPRIRKGIKTR